MIPPQKWKIMISGHFRGPTLSENLKKFRSLVLMRAKNSSVHWHKRSKRSKTSDPAAVILSSAGAVWPTSPDFTVEMMAAVIDRVQTAPASAHSNAIQESPGLSGDSQIHTECFRNGGETRQHTVYLLFVCVSCVCDSVKAFWGRVEWYFQWLQVASVRKCVIFVTIPPENKVYLSVKRQRFTIIQMTT